MKKFIALHLGRAPGALVSQKYRGIAGQRTKLVGTFFEYFPNLNLTDSFS